MAPFLRVPLCPGDVPGCVHAAEKRAGATRLPPPCPLLLHLRLVRKES